MTKLNEILHEYKGDIVDLGVSDINFTGIYTTLKDQSTISKYIHSQFTENANIYSKLYTKYGHFHSLVSNSCFKINLNTEKEIKILDLGSGSGNTIIPLLNIFPHSKIIASDLSLQFLSELRQIDNNKIRNGDLVLLQLNAEELNFTNNFFDLITGSSILHHLIHPDKTIDGCFKILKNGGHAIFYEPFEEGNMILCHAYEDILEDSKSEKISPKIRNFLLALTIDYKTRKGRFKSDELLNRLDDKWLFTKAFFYELSTKYNFNKCTIYPLHESEHQFEEQTMVNFHFISNDNPKDLLPSWAWKKISVFDEYFSEEIKKELLLTGCIIFEK